MADKARPVSWNQFLEKTGDQHSYKNQLIAQLEKDLRIIYSEHDAETIYKETLQILSEKVHNNQLGELLYRIDLNEKVAQNCMTQESPIDCITSAILSREAQKVYFRIQHSQGK